MTSVASTENTMDGGASGAHGEARREAERTPGGLAEG